MGTSEICDFHRSPKNGHFWFYWLRQIKFHIKNVILRSMSAFRKIRKRKNLNTDHYS